MPSGTWNPTQQLADLLLDGTLEDFVRSRRRAGRAWRLIERDLWEATDHKVDVTFSTLRRWYPDGDPAPMGNVEPLARSA